MNMLMPIYANREIILDLIFYNYRWLFRKCFHKCEKTNQIISGKHKQGKVNAMI